MSRRLSSTSDLSLSERDWLQQVVDYARLRGWRCYHTFDSRHSASGFPDLVMVRDTRLIFAELKTDDKKSKVTEAQAEWLGALMGVVNFEAPAVEVYVWRPSDFDEVVEVLK